MGYGYPVDFDCDRACELFCAAVSYVRQLACQRHFLTFCERTLTMAADVSTKADLPSAWLIRFSPYLKSGTRVLEIASGNGRNTDVYKRQNCELMKRFA